MRKNPRKQRGVSLLEVQIAGAISTVVLVAALMVMHSTDRAQMFATAHTNAMLQGGALFDEMLTDIRYCQFQSVIADSTRIRFRVPVDADGDGNCLDSTGTPQYGADGHVGWMREYALIKKTSLSEPADNMDYNGDGDKADLFDLCCINRNVYDAEGNMVKSVPLTGETIITTSPTGGGDIDGDGVNDPIFQLVDQTGSPGGDPALNTAVRVRLWWCARTSPRPQDFVLFRVLDSTVNLVNQD